MVAALAEGGHQSIRSFAEILGVSEMTIRRDVLGSSGRLTVLGGTVVGGAGGMPYDLDDEAHTHVAAKAAAGRHAATLIEAGDTIFVDCGSTMARLAALVPANQGITVVTYALNVANAASRVAGVQLVLVGGQYHPASAAFSGADGLKVIESARFNKAFISAGGIHETLGVSCSNFYEVPAKHVALRNAATAYVVADKSKYGQVKPAHFAGLADFAGFINEDGLSREAELAL